MTATLPGVSRVVTHVDEAWASGAQRWTFIGSLPYLFAVGARDVQMTAPYLHADADRVDRWRRRLASLGKGLNVGLVWAGRYSHGNDWRRSIPLEQLAALSELDGINFVSLQVGDTAIAADHVAPIRMLNVGSELADFAETAALICALDLLISADTAPAHLAGALGRPVWTLLPFMPDWRWRADHDVSSWYPSMRLFRQQRRGDWGELMNRVARELAAHASTRSLIG